MILLVVDTQDLIVDEALYAYEQFVSNIERVIKEAREKKVEVVYIRHNNQKGFTKGAEGFEIFEAFAPTAEEKIFDKYVNSAFKDSGLLQYLKVKDEKQIMVVGLQTDYCIDATIKCGFEHGLEMIVPADCNTTVDNEYLSGEASYKYYNEKMWPGRYAKCISFQEALEMLE